MTSQKVAIPTAAEAKAELARRSEQAVTLLLIAGTRAVYLTLRADADLSAIAGPAVLRTLDVTVLHALVLEQALGIDRAAQEAQTYLRYIKDNEQALTAAKQPDVQAVFMMNPTKVSQVMAVSEAGEVMPQKSTYFYPKIASGLVLNPLNPKRAGVDALMSESVKERAVASGAQADAVTRSGSGATPPSGLVAAAAGTVTAAAGTQLSRAARCSARARRRCPRSSWAS